MNLAYRALSVLVALVMAFAFVVALSTPTAAQEEVEIGEIVDNPTGFFGEEVRVGGPVEDVVTEGAFVTGAVDSDDRILVVGPERVVPEVVATGDVADVTGTVEEFNPQDEAFADLGIDFDDEAFEEFEGEPVVIAEDVALQTEDEAAEDEDEGLFQEDEDAGIFGEDEDEAVGEDRAVDELSLTDLIEDPDAFIGEQLSVTGEVQDVLVVGGAFTLGADVEAGELLVIGRAGDMPQILNENAIVRANGTLAFFNPVELEEDFGFDATFFDDEAFDDFDENDAVLVADSVTLRVPPIGEMIDNILGDPEPWFGEQVTLVGRVANDFGVQGFELEGTEGFLGIGENNLTVVGARNVLRGADVIEDAIVQVQGTVAVFNPVDLEEDFEFFDADDEDLEVFEGLDEGDPIIVADSVNVLATEPGETIEDILGDVDAFIDRRVTVAGNVNDVVADQAFTLEGEEGILGLGGDNLLVIDASGTAEGVIDDDVIVVAQGRLEFFDPASLEDEFGFDTGFFDDEAFDDFDENDPVLVATQVIPVAVAD